jgi:hypothetical protein
MDPLELCRQIEMTMADLGYEPPQYGETFESAAFKILVALRDMQRRLST